MIFCARADLAHDQGQDDHGLDGANPEKVGKVGRILEALHVV